jgi:hypothetical protein
MPMITTTIRSSIRVKPLLFLTLKPPPEKRKLRPAGLQVQSNPRGTRATVVPGLHGLSISINNNEIAVT